MNLEEILKDINLATLKKKSEVYKVDLGNVLFDSAQKAFGSGESMLEVLVYEAIVDKNRNEYMYDQYKKGYVLNHSVGMRYMKIFFCYNTEDPTFSGEKENWDKYIKEVFNSADAEKRGYMWAVTEAKNIEASSVVKGSNFLTPVLSVEELDENRIRVKCAISPSNIFDSHADVHIPGIWKKALKENNYDLFLQEHDMSFDKVIADSISGEVKVYTEMIQAKELLSKFRKRSNKSEPPSSTPKKDNQEPSADTLDEATMKRRKQLLNI